MTRSLPARLHSPHNQHGMLMLEGQGVMRFGDKWYPVHAGDAFWAAPFVPQWFGALGTRRTRFVESHYYGPASFLSSLMLFCIFPPCAIVPCIAPCDTRAYAIVADDAEPVVFARRRRARHLFVRVPSGTRPGDVVQTTAPDGRVVSARVPLRTGPGDMLRVDF